MKIEDQFRVAVPFEQAWNVLLDVERIAPCMPGAQLQEVEGDEYRGIVKVKVGPITAQYKGAARIVEADQASGRVVIKAEGRDTRGQGNASATVTATLVSDGDGTQVTIDTDLNVTGKVAQFGRGVMADVSSKLLGQFVQSLEENVLSEEAGGASTGGNGQAPAAGSEAPAPEAPGAAVATAPPPTEAPATGNGSAEGGVRKIEMAEAEPVDLVKTAGGAVGKRLVPTLLVVAVIVVIILWRRSSK
ncbi:MAG TPA: SRPBCC family protein [Acidimicrobiia bacterium]|nr:SRPBCC family protein [Acidimicrobiia bacterium]